MVEEFAAEERRFAFTAGRNLMVEEFAADMGQVVAFVDNPYHLDIKQVVLSESFEYQLAVHTNLARYILIVTSLKLEETFFNTLYFKKFKFYF